jgi:hypothetical protein
MSELECSQALSSMDTKVPLGAQHQPRSPTTSIYNPTNEYGCYPFTGRFSQRPEALHCVRSPVAIHVSPWIQPRLLDPLTVTTRQWSPSDRTRCSTDRTRYVVSDHAQPCTSESATRCAARRTGRHSASVQSFLVSSHSRPDASGRS